MSVMGLLVNLVGLFAFHTHAGHDHGHDVRTKEGKEAERKKLMSTSEEVVLAEL